MVLNKIQPDTISDRLHLVWIYPESLLGLLHIAPRLEMTRELRKIGWEVTFLAAGSKGNHIIDGVEFTCLPTPDIYLLRQVVFHLRVILSISQHWDATDIIFFHQHSLLFVLLLWLVQKLKGGNRPLFVMDTRTVPMEGEKGTLKDKIRGNFMLAMNSLANRSIDGQTAITVRMAELLQIPAKKLWGVFPSGVDIDQFLPARGKRIWPKSDEPIQIIYFGKLAAERNIMVLCEAVVQANQYGMSFELSLVGSGNQYDQLVEFACHSGDKVHVISQMPHNQIPEILSRMHIGALPFPDEPQFRVSSPIKLFEYMGAGLPILATRIVCHTDVIGDQPCVFWAEKSTVESHLAALRDVWIGRSRLASMGEVSYKVARNYTWAASAMKLSDALKFGMGITKK